MKIISCKEAKSLNFDRYYTGKPCKKGHISERYVQNNGCVTCVVLAAKAKKLKKTDGFRGFRVDVSEISVRAFPEKVPFLFQILNSMVKNSYPDAPDAFYNQQPGRPTRGQYGSFAYRFNCPVELIPQAHAAARMLLCATPAEVVAARERLFPSIRKGD